MAGESVAVTRRRSDSILAAGGLLVAVALDAVVGLWATRTLVRSRRTPDVSDPDGAFFDPHGFVTLFALALALAAVAAMPLLWVELARLRPPWDRLRSRQPVRAAVAAGGAFWGAVGAAAVRLDTSTAHLDDPALGGPRGTSLLEPLGYALVVVGTVVGAVAVVLLVRGWRAHRGATRD